MAAEDGQRKEDANKKPGYRSWATEVPKENFLGMKGRGYLPQKKTLEN